MPRKFEILIAIVAAAPRGSVPCRVQRFLPRRYVLLFDVRYGGGCLLSFPDFLADRSPEYRTLLLSLRERMGQPAYLQLFPLTLTWLLLHASWNMACVAVPPPLSRHSQRLSTSSQLWKVYCYHSFLRHTQYLPHQQEHHQPRSLYYFCCHQFSILQYLGCRYGLEPGRPVREAQILETNAGLQEGLDVLRRYDDRPYSPIQLDSVRCHPAPTPALGCDFLRRRVLRSLPKRNVDALSCRK